MFPKEDKDKDEVEDVVVAVVKAEDSMFLTTVQESLGNGTFLSSIKSYHIKELMRFSPGIEVLLKIYSSLHVISTS